MMFPISLKNLYIEEPAFKKQKFKSSCAYDKLMYLVIYLSRSRRCAATCVYCMPQLDLHIRNQYLEYLSIQFKIWDALEKFRQFVN